MNKFDPGIRETSSAKVFKESLPVPWFEVLAINQRPSLDGHIPGPDFQTPGVHPQNNADDTRFKRNLLQDLDKWVMEEVNIVTETLNAHVSDEEQAGL